MKKNLERKTEKNFSGGGGAGLPLAATGGLSVFIGPTLPEEEDEEVIVQDPGDEEQTRSISVSMPEHRSSDLFFQCHNFNVLANRGWCWRVTKFIFRKSRSKTELGVGLYNVSHNRRRYYLVWV